MDKGTVTGYNIKLLKGRFDCLFNPFFFFLQELVFLDYLQLVKQGGVLLVPTNSTYCQWGWKEIFHILDFQKVVVISSKYNKCEQPDSVSVVRCNVSEIYFQLDDLSTL